MNDMIQMYTDKSRPKYCTEKGMVDEIVDMTDASIHPGIYRGCLSGSAVNLPDASDADTKKHT